jgi:predicted nucleic acid-binding protein
MNTKSQVSIVADANVWIDLKEARLIEAAFRLPCLFATPDVICDKELMDPPAEKLRELGLRCISLPGHVVLDVARLRREYKSPGLNDLFALALAKWLGWPLLTGDKDLRIAAEKENVSVHGILWLLDMMVLVGVCSPLERGRAILRMLRSGRRLPGEACGIRLKCAGLKFTVEKRP